MIVYSLKIGYIILSSVQTFDITKKAFMERFMTTEEVAELLRIDAVTVRRLIMRGELTAYRIAGEFRFTPTDLEKFIESQRVMVNVAAKNQFGDKFTDQARHVLSQANEEARRYNHTGIGTEHLLLAIMSEDAGIAVEALAQLQVQPSEVREQIETLRPTGEQPVGNGQIGLTAQGKDSIELAVQEARSFGHHYLGTEHLLLGLLREEKEPGGQVLRKAGVTLEETRNIVKQLLAKKQATSEPEPEQHSES
jgi:excisionase family DNA binding protein